MTSAVTMVLQRMLGTEVDLKEFYDFASQDPEVESIGTPFPWGQASTLPSVFEALVNGISCQQLSLRVGITLLNRLTAQVKTTDTITSR